MIILFLKVLMATFIFSSILHGVMCYLGKSALEFHDFSEKGSVSLFRFHTESSVRKYIQEPYMKRAILFLAIRNWSFIAFAIFSGLEYILR